MIFERLYEPNMVSTAWHQIGTVYREAGDYESAETACVARSRYNPRIMIGLGRELV